MAGWSRRHFLETGAAAAASLPFAPLARAATGKPNILFILADDLGYADLSCYGRRDYTTPHLDGLAAQGAKLLQGYANSAVCTATRAALISGQYQYRIPVGLEEPLGGYEIGLHDMPTMPSLMRKAGYRTTLIGKWHLGGAPEFNPTNRGYDEFYGLVHGGADYFRHTLDLAKDDPRDRLYDDKKTVDESGYLTDMFADRTIRTIERSGDKPFFISLHFNAPHWPWEGPGDEAVSRELKNAMHFDGGNLKIYAAMMKSMDDNIGRILGALDRAGKAEDTIVVFTSDNGGERFSDMWPFIGQKGELLEGGLRVPLIVRWPGKIAPGESDQVMISMDFLLTLLAAAGGKPDAAAPTDGENLLPVLLGQAPVHARKLFWRFQGKEQAAVRDGNWKYLRIAGNEFLFDVVEDQRERANLKDKSPEIFARLKSDWNAWNAQMLPYTRPDRAPRRGIAADRY